MVIWNVYTSSLNMSNHVTTTYLIALEMKQGIEQNISNCEILQRLIIFILKSEAAHAYLMPTRKKINQLPFAPSSV